MNGEVKESKFTLFGILMTDIILVSILIFWILAGAPLTPMFLVPLILLIVNIPAIRKMNNSYRKGTVMEPSHPLHLDETKTENQWSINRRIILDIILGVFVLIFGMWLLYVMYNNLEITVIILAFAIFSTIVFTFFGIIILHEAFLLYKKLHH